MKLTDSNLTDFIRKSKKIETKEQTLLEGCVIWNNIIPPGNLDKQFKSQK